MRRELKCVDVRLQSMLSVIQIISLLFTNFSTEECCDFVYLYDGYDSSAKQIDALAGNVSMPRVYGSTQQYLYIRFTTGGTGGSSGFSAAFKSTIGDYHISLVLVDNET